MARAILRTAVAVGGTAVAIWLLPSSQHIVGWPPSGPIRVALLAPWLTLWLYLAGAGAVLVGVAVAGAVAGPRIPERIAAALAPLGLLWLWAVPYLPWLPDRAPLLLVLAGPLRWGIAGLALAGCVWAVTGPRFWSRLRGPLPGRWVVLLATFVVYASFGLWSAAEVGPGGDEPHYLIIAQSLLRDHDLQIENNHVRGDYREYFGGTLRPDYLRRGLNGTIYSIHAPGLPAILAAAYAVAGYRGAVLLICLIGALAALAMFDLAERLGSRGAAWSTVAAISLTVPFMPLAWMIYPEMPGALLTAWAVLWLYTGVPDRPRVWALRGIALGLLPWLHTKFVVLLAVLAAGLLIRLWPRSRTMAAFAVPLVGSLGAWLYFFHRLYGVFDPQAPYGDSALQMGLENIPRGVLGLMFDQKFGLLVYSPVYLLAVAGAWLMLRRRDLRGPTVAVMLTALAFVASTTRFNMWWGGSSAPARFLVPALPLAAPLMATAFNELRSAAGRAMAAGLLGLGLCIALAGVMWPERLMLFSAPHGVARLAEAVEGGSPLSWALPTFTEERLDGPLALLGSWLIAGLLGGAVGLLVRRFDSRTGFRALAAGLMAFTISGATLAGASGPEGRRATADRGRLALIAFADPPRLRPYDYGMGRSLDDREMLMKAQVSRSRAAGDLFPRPERLAGPFMLPPGRFTARIWFDGQAPIGSRAWITIRNRAHLAELSGPWSNPAQLSFGLPVAAPVSVAFSDEEVSRLAQQVEIVAESVVPRSARLAIEVHAIEGIDNRMGAYVVHAGRDTYPEGGVFWTRGTRPGAVFVAPGGASTMVLTLRVGPVGSRVNVRVAQEHHSFDFAPGETRAIEVPIPATHGLVPVTVEAAQQFRPRDHDPGSADSRWLGCQVRIGLK